MRRLHVEVLLLTFLLLVFVAVIIVAPHVRVGAETLAEFTKWGALVLGALLATLTGRTNRPQ